jgi:hypothetical protein
MFPVAEKVTLYRLTDGERVLGLFSKPGDREAMNNASAVRAKIVTKNETTGQVTEKVHLFVPVGE